MDSTTPIVMTILGIVAITAIVVAFLRKFVRGLSGAAAVLVGTLLVPVLWVLWGLTFLYTGTPSSDHDESQVYLGVALVMAILSLPLSFATGYVTVRVLRRSR